MKIALNGACGKMGARISLLALEKGHDIAAAFEYAAHPAQGRELGQILGRTGLPVSLSVSGNFNSAADILIDFSSPSGFTDALNVVLQKKIPFLSGTTGLLPGHKMLLAEASAHIPVLHSANMSFGVNLLALLVRQAAQVLAQYDAEIVEIHHNAKKDAPSGTALMLGREIAVGRNTDLQSVAVHGRSGAEALRVPGTIGFHAVRGGDVTGDHTVFFAGDGERLELTHRAHSRDVLAQGAIKAAEWLVAGKKPGLYTMADVLGIG